MSTLTCTCDSPDDRVCWRGPARLDPGHEWDENPRCWCSCHLTEVPKRMADDSEGTMDESQR